MAIVWKHIRSKARILLTALLRVLLFIGAILMTAAVIWLAIQIFTGDKDLDPDFPPTITTPEDRENDGNVTDTQPSGNDNGGMGPGSSGSNLPSGQAAPSNPQGSPSAPSPAEPSQPGLPPEEPVQPILPIFPVNPPPLLDPVLDPLQPVTDPLLNSDLLGPVLQ